MLSAVGRARCPRVLTAQVWAPAGLRGVCSGRSKSRELASKITGSLSAEPEPARPMETPKIFFFSLWRLLQEATGYRLLVCFFNGHHGWRSSYTICAGWRAFTPHKGNGRITQCDSVCGMADKQYADCCPWKWPHGKANQLIGRCHPYARKSASQALLSRMQLTLHATRRTPHGA